MTWKRYNIMILAIFIGTMLVSILMNVLIDPYDIFHVTHLGNGFTPDQRFNKVRYLLTVPHKYNAFIVGSSRMGVYSPKLVDAYDPGYRYYNLSVFGGDARDALLMLRYLHAHGVKVKAILMGIDLFPFLMTNNIITPSYREYPGTVGESKFSFYFDFLFQPSIYHCFIKLETILAKRPKIRFDFRHTGQFFLLQMDRQIRANHQEYVSTHFNYPTHKPVEASFVKSRFNELIALKHWLDVHHVICRFFIHPHNQLILENLKPDVYRYFVKRVRQILGNIPDFTQYSDWRTNNLLYYDKQHYRRSIADKIIAMMYNHPPQQDVKIAKMSSY